MMNGAPFSRDDCAGHAIPVFHKEARQAYHPIHLHKYTEEASLSTIADAQTPPPTTSAWEELTRLVKTTSSPPPSSSFTSKDYRSYTTPTTPLEQKTTAGGKASDPATNMPSQLCRHCPAAALTSLGPIVAQRYHIHKYSDILVLTDPYIALHSAILHHRECFGCTPTHLVVPRRAYELMADRHRRQMGVELRQRYPFFNGTGLDYVTLHPCDIDLPGRPSALPPWLQPSATQLGIRLQPDTLLTISLISASELALTIPVTSQSFKPGGQS
jgi:hypothetical protein